MTEKTAKPQRRKPSRAGKAPLHSAARQPVTPEAWRQFADRLLVALCALEEDEFLVLQVKGTDRYVQFMDQGAFGLRAESVSDFYLSDGDHLGEEDYRALMNLGWHAPTRLPEFFGHDFDGSSNYYVDLARPVSVEDVAVMAVLTLIHVHRAGHPGRLEYDARSLAGLSIRLPTLGIRRRAAEAQA